jgi:hypothetical protein
VTEGQTWRARLRFRLQKKLQVEESERRLRIAGREVVLSSPTPDVAIKDSEWLVMNARGFASEVEAKQFGGALKTALDVSAVSARVGVDTGQDLATSGLFKAGKDLFVPEGILVRDNVHGLDVFLDDPSTRICALNMTAVIRASPDPFLGDLDELVRTAVAPSPQITYVVLLLNYALMHREPAAQIVFAVSAVEALAQDETWSSDQRRLLSQLAVAADESAIGTESDRQEVSDAIRKSLFRLSLRQGVFRLLRRLDLERLRKQWDDLYDERCALIHGLAPRRGANYGNLAHRTIGLCGQILLKAAAAEIPQADRHVSRMYAS